MYHVIRPEGAAHLNRPHVIVHRMKLYDDEVTVLDGIPLTTPERTWLDLAEMLTVDGATAGVERRLALMPPATGVNFEAGKAPAVSVRVKVRPRRGDREFKVELDGAVAAALAEKADDVQTLQPTAAERVRVRGSLPALRQLGELESPFVVSAEVESAKLPRRRSKQPGSAKLRLRIGFSDEVPEEVASQLDVEPESLRLDLALQRITAEKPAP